MEGGGPGPTPVGLKPEGDEALGRLGDHGEGTAILAETPAEGWAEKGAGWEGNSPSSTQRSS